MPANLPPQYFEAEKNFRVAKNTVEKIAALEEMLAIMPKHKGTDHLRAELRSRIAKLTQQAAKKSGTQRASMTIERSTISLNTADLGGGGVMNWVEENTGFASLYVSDSTIDGNTADIGGGLGNYVDDGDAMVSISRTTISSLARIKWVTRTFKRTL